MWDKKGENLTFKWFRMLSEQSQDKLAIIVGDSQTAYSGRALENILKGNGYEVIRNFKTGENTNKTIQRLSTISPDRPVSLVAVFTGGNNPNAAFSETATANLIELIRRKFGEGVEIVIGAAPPARTGDPAMVKRVFGRDSHSESLKARRREMADAIITTANSMGVKAVNPHTAGFLDDDINTGDGIHLKGSDAQNFAEAIASQITGRANTQAPISAVIKDFSGKRLATSKLRGLDLVQLARYAKSRASACQGMGYFTIGSKGDEVKEIQDRLADLGLNPPTKDEEAYGTFDLRTLYNIIAFQKMSKIRTDGCVGPETMGALGADQTQKDISTGGPVTPVNQEEVAKLSKQDVAKIIVKVAEEEGFDPVAALTMARIESGLNPLSNLKKGSYKGLYQFGRQFKKTWAKYGLNWKRGDQFNPEQSARVFMRLMKDRLKNLFPEIKDFRNIPSDKQYFIYLLWQQGPSGAASVKRAADRGGRYTSRQYYENSINNWYSAYPYSAGKQLTDPDTGKTISIEGKNRKQMARELNPARKQRGLKQRKIGSISYLLSKQTFNDQIMRPKDFLNKWERTYARFRKRAMDEYGSHIGQRAIS